VLYTGTLRRCGLQGYWYLVYDHVYHAKGCGVLFSLGYNDNAALFPWERYILYPFRLTAISQLLCLTRVEAEKLGQAGFGLRS